MSNSVVLGVDPAKRKFTACLIGAKGEILAAPEDFSPDRAGLAALLTRIAPHRGPDRPLIAAVEATASLDDNLLSFFAAPAAREDGPVRLYRLDAAQVARFSGARPVRGKTDSADALRVARFALAHHAQLDAFENDPEALAMLRLVNERAQLVQEITALTNRLQDRLIIAFPEFGQVFKKPCGDLALAVLETIRTAAGCARKRPATLAAIRPGKGRHALGMERAEQLVALAKVSVASAVLDFDGDAVVHLVERIRLDRRRLAVIETRIEAYAAPLDPPAPSAAGPVQPLPPSESPAEEPVRSPAAAPAAAAPEPAVPTLPAGVPEQIRLLTTIPGVGWVGAACVALRCRGLARFDSAKALAAQLAACPDRVQTGSSKNHGRLTRRGDRRTRSTLFELAQAACAHDPAMAFHKWRLVQNGLTPKQAVCACMNRLVRVMWAVVHSKRPYDPVKAVANVKNHHADLWKAFLKDTLPSLKSMGKDAKKFAAAA